jgi:hypothetical protein
MCRDGDREALIIPAWLETRSSVLVESAGGWSLVDDDLEAVELILDEPPGAGGAATGTSQAP